MKLAIPLGRPSFSSHRLRKRAAAVIARAADWALFLGIVLFGGLGTSWYMVEAGTRLTTQTQGPWISWTATGRRDADPYTRAHDARRGTLSLSADVAQTFYAHTDGTSLKLHSSCDYVLQGRDLPAHWWSIAVFDERGRLIPNAAQRYAYTSDTIATSSDGAFTIALARDARPSNWLPTGGAGRLVLVLTLVDPGEAPRRVRQQEGASALPVITKVACR